MTSDFLTFKEFNDIELANDFGGLLKAQGIDYLIENNKYLFDVSFANNSINPDVSLKIKGSDFPEAQNILNKYYEDVASSVNKDYYLFEFSDHELIEIISKPDEWGEFDYNVAQSILKSRGKEINPIIVKILQDRRMETLSVPEQVNSAWVYRGYVSAIFGGLFGIIFGYNLAYSKKTLRNGEHVYSYDEQNRKHGERILYIGIASLIIWLFLILYFICSFLVRRLKPAVFICHMESPNDHSRWVRGNSWGFHVDK